MKPGDKVQFVHTPKLVGAWVRRGDCDYTVVPGGTAHSNARVRNDETGAIEHISPAAWTNFTLVALPPVCPDTPAEAVAMNDDVARRLEADRRFVRMAREVGA